MLPGEPGKMLPGLWERLGDVLALVGRHEEGRAAFEGAIARLGEEGRIVRARLWRKAGKTQETQHRHERALVHYSSALDALGEPGPAAIDGWWDEWIQVQIDRASVNYWLGDLGHSADKDAFVTGLRPIVEAHAKPIVRARFYQAMAQLRVQQERYRPSALTLDLPRACLSAARETGDANEIAWAGFGLACVLMLRGSLEEAEVEMRAALALAEEHGNLPVSARCLAYLATILRLRGDVEAVRAIASLALEMSEAGHMPIYAGAACGHLAWVAHRDGRLEDVFREGEAALRLWDSPEYVYPFQWIARMPLMNACLEAGRHEEAAAHRRAMQAPSQQELTDEELRGGDHS